MTPEEKQRLQSRARALSSEGLQLLNLSIIERREFTDSERDRYAVINTELAAVEKDLTGETHGGSVKDIHARLSQFPNPADTPTDETEGHDGELQAVECLSKKWSELRAICGGEAHAGNWRDQREYLAAVASGRHHPELHSQSSVSDDLGGFAVSDEMAAGIFDVSLESEIVRPRARVFGMRSSRLRIPVWSNFDHSGGSLYGGIRVQWAGEASTLNTQTAKMQRVELEAKKMAFLGKMPSELSEDAPNFAGDFQLALTKAAGFHMDSAFLLGAGPHITGVLNAPGTIAVAAEAAQAAATINYTNLVKMFSRALNPMAGVWVVNQSTLPQLLQLSIALGTAGDHIQVLREGANGMTMLTRPVLVTEKTPALGTVGDIMFCDFSHYVIGMRAEVSLLVSPHVFFDSDELAFRLRTRLDGKPILSGPITPEFGDTLSPFIVLATRS